MITQMNERYTTQNILESMGIKNVDNYSWKIEPVENTNINYTMQLGDPIIAHFQINLDDPDE